jgi:hypothetical protein
MAFDIQPAVVAEKSGKWFEIKFKNGGSASFLVTPGTTGEQASNTNKSLVFKGKKASKSEFDFVAGHAVGLKSFLKHVVDWKDVVDGGIPVPFSKEKLEWFLGLFGLTETTEIDPADGESYCLNELLSKFIFSGEYFTDDTKNL